MIKRSQTRWFPVICAALSLTLALTACAGGAEKNNTAKPAAKPESKTTKVGIASFTPALTNSKPAIKGGVLNYGSVVASAFEGILNPTFSRSSSDTDITQFFHPSLFAKDANFEIIDGGAANLTFAPDNKSFTVTLDDKLNWSDGNPVTAEDYAFAFEVIGHPDYDGVRYVDSFRNIIGMEEYHAGKTTTISGIETKGLKQVTIHLKQPDPSTKISALRYYPLHKKAFKGIAVKDMSGSDPVRKNPIGYGPFKIKSIVPGEAVEFVANKDYFRGPPKLDGIRLKVVHPDIIVEELKSGKIDAVNTYPTPRYDLSKNPKNVEFVADKSLSYSYLGFKLGKFDATKNLLSKIKR